MAHLPGKGINIFKQELVDSRESGKSACRKGVQQALFKKQGAFALLSFSSARASSAASVKPSLFSNVIRLPLYEHLFKTGFLDILQQCNLTLMKGDKAVELAEEGADFDLFLS